MTSDKEAAKPRREKIIQFVFKIAEKNLASKVNENESESEESIDQRDSSSTINHATDGGESATHNDSTVSGSDASTYDTISTSDTNTDTDGGDSIFPPGFHRVDVINEDDSHAEQQMVTGPALEARKLVERYMNGMVKSHTADHDVFTAKGADELKTLLYGVIGRRNQNRVAVDEMVHNLELSLSSTAGGGRKPALVMIHFEVTGTESESFGKPGSVSGPGVEVSQGGLSEEGGEDGADEDSASVVMDNVHEVGETKTLFYVVVLKRGGVWKMRKRARARMAVKRLSRPFKKG